MRKGRVKSRREEKGNGREAGESRGRKGKHSRAVFRS